MNLLFKFYILFLISFCFLIPNCLGNLNAFNFDNSSIGMVCDKENSIFMLINEFGFIIFEGRNPSGTFRFGTPSKPDESFYISIFFDRIVELSEKDEEILSFDLSQSNFNVTCETEWSTEINSTNLTAISHSIMFSLRLPNNATFSSNQTVELNSIIWGNLLQGFIQLTPSSLLPSFTVEKWNRSISHSRIKLYVDAQTSIGLLAVNSPEYYPSGNIKQDRVSGTVRDIIIHLSDVIAVFNESNHSYQPEYQLVAMDLQEKSISPIRGTLGISFATPSDINMKCVYSMADELVTLDGEFNWMLVLIAIAIVIPIICLFVIVFCFIWKKYPYLHTPDVVPEKSRLINQSEN